jgi:hypothetical protein
MLAHPQGGALLIEQLMNIDIALERAKRRTFAIAYHWPGWARSGKNEDSAIQTLFTYGPRYADVFQSKNCAFKPPEKVDAFRVVERLEGNSTTDFGAPAMQIRNDNDTVSRDDLARFQTMLVESWRTFDQALSASEGIELRKGPRGGGRDQQKMMAHVIMADESYLAKLGWKYPNLVGEDPAASLKLVREAIIEGLEASVLGEIPEKGPRGGLRWTPRFFVRRVIWHILDHAWEIEDRMI